MRPRRRRARLALMATVVVTVSIAGVAAHETNLLRWLELQTIDARFMVRGKQASPRDVAVVAVDAKTFNELDKPGSHQPLQWPYPRRYHAQAIKILKAAGARVIAYDVQFTEPTNNYDDNALINAVYDAGNVVLGTSEIGRGGHTRIFGGDSVVHQARALPASAQYNLDPNGVIRRIPYQTDGLRTMPVVAYTRAFGHPPSHAGFGDQGAWIDFVGPPHTVPTVSFVDLLHHHFPPGFFRGRIVVVGASAPSLQDVHPTSTSGADEMPGPEIQANAIHTIERGVPLRPVPDWIDIALILVMALVAPLPSLRVGTLLGIGAALLGTAIFLVAAQVAFDGGHIVVVTYPLLAALLATLGVFGVHYFTEVRERRRTRTAFARFVPEAVVDRVLEHAEDGLRLGGEEVLGTVMFSDIRGFTTFSESQPAGEVIEILNKYLSEMTDAIMGHGGTLIAYLGDGILAIFGAPLEQADHADRALAAAQEMLGTRLARFNTWLNERGIEQPFAMGIGVNSGLFMAGNVGSQNRLEYTVIGDTVNTASRMEGLTKGSGHSLFIAESTRFMLLGEAPPLDYVGEFAIRGREAKMKIWAPALPVPPSAERIDQVTPEGADRNGREASGLDRPVQRALKGAEAGGRAPGG
jgi:adenylate cyclase